MPNQLLGEGHREPVNIYSREWPPDPEPEPAKPPPSRRVLIMLLLIVLLFVGSPLAMWLVAVLPGDHEWAFALWPAGWFAAVLVFLAGSYLDIRSRSRK